MVGLIEYVRRRQYNCCGTKIAKSVWIVDGSIVYVDFPTN